MKHTPMARPRVEPVHGYRPPTTQAPANEIGDLIIATTSNPPARTTPRCDMAGILAVGCGAHPLQRRLPRP